MQFRNCFKLACSLVCLPGVVYAQQPPAASADYVGSAACKTCHPATYQRWSKTRMANVVRDPNVHPDAIIPDLSKPNPLVKFTKDDIAFVYGSKWKQRYFTKKGDDYFPLGAQWDVTHQTLARIHGSAQHRLVGAVLPRGQHATPNRPALRRLPLRELQHSNEDGDGVECGLRKMPRAGRGARAATFAKEHHQSSPARQCAGDQRLHAMPFAGATVEQSDQRQILRLAGGFPSGDESQGLLETGGAQARASRHSHTSPTAPPTRTGCRVTTLSKAPCTHTE